MVSKQSFLCEYWWAEKWECMLMTKILLKNGVSGGFHPNMKSNNRCCGGNRFACFFDKPKEEWWERYTCPECGFDLGKIKHKSYSCGNNRCEKYFMNTRGKEIKFKDVIVATEGIVIWG